MLDILVHQDLEIKIAPDGRVWINGPDGCLFRMARGNPDGIVVVDERGHDGDEEAGAD